MPTPALDDQGVLPSGPLFAVVLWYAGSDDVKVFGPFTDREEINVWSGPGD